MDPIRLHVDDAGQIVGSLTLVWYAIPTGVKAWIEDVVVDDSARGSGVGAALNTAKVQAGSSAVIFGAGGIGLNVIQGCALAGAEKIIAVDLEDKKLAFAQQFGATHTLDASRPELGYKTAFEHVLSS